MDNGSGAQIAGADVQNDCAATRHISPGDPGATPLDQVRGSSGQRFLAPATRILNAGAIRDGRVSCAVAVQAENERSDQCVALGAAEVTERESMFVVICAEDIEFFAKLLKALPKKRRDRCGNGC